MFSQFQSIRKKLFSIGHFESFDLVDAGQDLLSFPVATE